LPQRGSCALDRQYTHGVAISNSRLIAADARAVTFTFKGYRIIGPGRDETMTLEPDEFMRRFPLHAATDRWG
jgi:putative transposase